MDLQDQPDPPVQIARLRVQLDLLDLQVLQVHKVQLAPQVLKELLDLQVLLDLKEFKALLDLQDLPGLQAQLELTVR